MYLKSILFFSDKQREIERSVRDEEREISHTEINGTDRALENKRISV